ncbi:MAG: Fur family transcriptional regulator [Myxococcota bacterium]
MNNAGASPSAEPLEILRDYVAKNGLKFTRQRELIADVFFRAGGHLKVEDLLEEVRKEDPQVSLATIYRTMKLLTECGLAEPHRFGDGHTRYEPSDAEDEHHDHLICTECGHIIEFFNQQLETLQEAIAASHGFEVHDHRMEMYGTCKNPKTCEHNRNRS